jgi:hypothetical protein
MTPCEESAIANYLHAIDFDLAIICGILVLLCFAVLASGGSKK